MTRLMSTYPVFQHAYYVKDLDATVNKWATLYYAGPFMISHHHVAKKFHYRGTDTQADVSYAFGYLGDMQIQFVQQHDDKPSIYRDMYKAGEEGFHHLALMVHDFEAEYERYLQAGFVDACRLYAANVDACYFDTRTVNGGFTELHGDDKYILGLFAQWKRAHELFKPGDNPILTL
jgi:hypothetical protein